MFDLLEPRRLFSIGVENGVLVVRGSSAGERLFVSWKLVNTANWEAKVSDGKHVQNWGWSGHNSWNGVSIYGGNGADYISAAGTVEGFTNTFVPPVPITLNGGAGNDTLHGGETGDTLLGGSANDSLFGHTGSDSINGESGNDSMNSELGNDTLIGGDGNDTAFAGIGSDVLSGGNGNDSLDGGRGDDLISGGPGADALFAGTDDQPPFFRGTNLDDGMDTLFGSASGSADDAGDELFI